MQQLQQVLEEEPLEADGSYAAVSALRRDWVGHKPRPPSTKPEIELITQHLARNQPTMMARLMATSKILL